ncbi:DUF3347 domain-containing protein [Arenibacter sp. GZD96]|uniref:DUF3347 domain-containing protein n=1 Tax=Aurantibrevibacter litoralis TaxID=3106030 RepID=UPI002AFDDC63|nr:DUF3347 domain-containing protein [Arenibacter sp. GZD-96]MEA1785471.1 DUF3347 domain-containing protein [Arenibacter sp. GZD-96]
MNKKNRLLPFIVVLGSLGIIFSCKDNKDAQTPEAEDQQPKTEDVRKEAKENADVNGQNSTIADGKSSILDFYFEVKDALVADDAERAVIGASAMHLALENFNLDPYAPEEQVQLKPLLLQGKVQSSAISKTTIEDQRKHFKELNATVTEIVAITGTPYTVYEQHCPMYDKGSSWLSMSSAIKNPYYGSTMLHCGSVQREIKM